MTQAQLHQHPGQGQAGRPEADEEPTFLRNAWYVAGWSHEIGAEQPVGTTIIGLPVVLFRPDGRGIAALEDRCAHRHAPLSLGRCEGSNLRCMYHGLLFDRSGACVQIPGQDTIPSMARVTSYPAVERGGWVWVWMGDVERADPDLIPQFTALDDDGWHFGSGKLEYSANYQLINDNLTDFSHLSFVHANSFNAGLNWALSIPLITPLERGIRVQRWVADDPVPPYLQYGGNCVDHYVFYDYLAPGILLLSTEIHAGGTAALHPDFDSRPEPLFATFSPQAVTPIDAQNTWYYFAWGPRAIDGSKDTASLMMEVARQAFAEDKLIIEAQQRTIERCPAKREMPIAADKGVTLFQRKMKSLMKLERSVGGSASPAGSQTGDAS
jgi:vanillate O-demethylase monooxygenase subunit